MGFACRQCGSCCMYLGDYISIERQIGPFDFECCSVSTGTPFIARIDDDKRELFREREWIDLQPHACRFLRPAVGGRIVCTIHETSPVQCKMFRCTVMEVFLPSGEPVGRVTGTLALHSDDPVLRTLWEEEIRFIVESAPDAEGRVALLLREKGYRVV